MAAFVLAVAVGLTLGDGPARVSVETVEGLDLRGEWEGTWWLAEGLLYPATMDERFISGCDPNVGAIFFRVSSVIDEGNGKLRIEPKEAAGRWLGIYEQHDGRVVVCCGEDGKERPRTFRGGDGQHLIILHRVKPGKPSGAH